MQELSKEQIDKAEALLNGFGIAHLVLRRRIEEAAQYLQYAPAPVDGDVIDIMCGTFQIAEDNGVKRMAAAAQVLQSRHDAELAEYKKALGPVTDEEQAEFSIHYMMLGPSADEAVNTPLLTKGQATKLLASRRALLEKKPEPEIPEGMLKAVKDRYRGTPNYSESATLEDLKAALRWQRDNQA